MRFGIEVVPFGDYAVPGPVLELAQAAEAAGWEAIWLWDHLLFPWGAGDPWVTLAAVAATTERLKLVTGVAALPRYQPAALARQLVALDRLSQGRLVLGAGAGALREEFVAFGLPGEARTRAEMLDEGLELITRLWSGEPVDYHGRHYTATAAALRPTPAQQPRVPVWIGGESRAALRRAARWDGWMMGCVNEEGQVTCPPERIARDLAAIRSCRAAAEPFDLAVDGMTAAGETALPQAYGDAGATWWFEVIYPLRGSHAELLARVRAGPPH